MTIALLVPAAAGPSAAPRWDPVPENHIRMREPLLDASADAEILLEEVRIEDTVDRGLLKSILQVHKRVKVYSQSGIEAHGEVSIPYDRDSRVSEISARTVQTDGRIIELDRKSIFDRPLHETGSSKLSAVTFAMPGVAPGSIIEYRYRVERRDHVSHHLVMHFQRDLPALELRYVLRPLEVPGVEMIYTSRNGAPKGFTNEGHGYYSLSAHRTPAFKAESDMPSRVRVIPSTIVYYRFIEYGDTKDHWNRHAKKIDANFRARIRTNDVIRTTLANIVGGVTEDRERLRLLYDACQSRIRNVDDPANPSPAERHWKARRPDDTLKHGLGGHDDVNGVFAALASAAGFDVRSAHVSDRDAQEFDIGMTDPELLDHHCIAVRQGSGWLFLDPGDTRASFGMMNRDREGEVVLICTPDSAVFLRSPIAAPIASAVRIVAGLTLGQDGTLAGDARIDFTGHAAAALRASVDGKDADSREGVLRDALGRRVERAEVTDLKVEGLQGSGTLRLAFRLRISDYARPVGDGLYLKPAVFDKDRDARFSDPERIHPVHFPYAWAELDTIRIRLPEGWRLEPADPAQLHLATASQYMNEIWYAPATNTVEFTRFFQMGLNGFCWFDSEAYPALREYFQNVRRADGNGVMLQPVAARPDSMEASQTLGAGASTDTTGTGTH